MNQDYSVMMIPIKDILRDTDWNCRGRIAPIEVLELMKDIDKNGLLSPVIVMPWNKGGFKWKLVAGFCRTMAFEQLNKPEIPAFVHVGIDDAQARVINLRENLHRRDLNIVQEANAIGELKYKEGFSPQQIAKEFGRSTTWVDVRLKLLELEPEIRAVAASGIFTQEQIKTIWNTSQEKRFELVRKIKAKTFRLDDVRPDKPMKKVFKRKDVVVPERAFIEAVQDRIWNVTKGSILTRCLAWCSGNISYEDFKIDLLAHLEAEGFDSKGYKDDV